MSPPLRLIPVMDLRAGRVVRARRGERATYRPLSGSALGAGPEPLDCAERLLAACASRVLYLADLDALQGGAPQTAVIARLLRALPGLTLWLDAGFRRPAEVQALAEALDCPRAGGAPLAEAARPGLRPVWASEALPDAAALQAALPDAAARAAGLLSLDRRGDTLLDPAGCWGRPEAWPDSLILMTLERVGSGDGPDLALLRRLHAATPGKRWIGAGGLRGPADAEAAAAAGASAWLVASALHEGRLGPGRSG